MSEQPPTPKPLDQKTDTELKREAKSRLIRLNPGAAAALVEETLSNTVNHSTSGFIDFLREKAIVGLAVGFVIGAQVQAVVKQFIASFVDPLFKLLTGNQALSDLKWSVHLNGHKAADTADFAWGGFVYSLLDFLFIVFIIYIVIRVFKLEQLDKKT